MDIIRKERLWVFSPVTQIVFSADMIGCKDKGEFTRAVDKAMGSYPALKKKVEINESGEAFFVPMERPNYVLAEDRRSIDKIINEQERILLDIWKGEFIRLFYSEKKEGFRIIIIAHHIIGDGLSFAYLLEQILKALAGQELEEVPDKGVNMDKLKAGSKLSFPIPLMMKQMNQKWEKTNKIFTQQEYIELFNKYWEKHKSYVTYSKIEEEDFSHLINFSKSTGLTINTLLTTALMEVDGSYLDCGLAVSIREKDNIGLGNFASGISIKYHYDPNKNFISNAEKIQKLIRVKTEDINRKMFLLNFMDGITPTLIDAIYFASCSLCDNSVAKRFAKMFGYMGNPKGLSITNLRELPIKTDMGTYSVDNIMFVPPLILNAVHLIGVATAKDRLIVSLHLDGEKEIDDEVILFHKAIKRLKAMR